MSKDVRKKTPCFDSFFECSSTTSTISAVTGTRIDYSKMDKNDHDKSQNTTGTSSKRKNKAMSDTNITCQYAKIKKISDVYASFELPKSTRQCIPTLTNLRNEDNLDKKMLISGQD